MQPIFKNTDVSRVDVGKHMQDYAEANDLLTQPRRALVGSFYGKKILLATPVLKWYLEQGLRVTDVYQLIQYTPETCFKQFGDEVSEARRTGDVDPSQAVVGNTMKLLGK
jgi:hypothetical protein